MGKVPFYRLRSFFLLNVLLLQCRGHQPPGSHDGLHRQVQEVNLRVKGGPGGENSQNRILKPPYEEAPLPAQVGGRFLQFSRVWQEQCQDRWVASSISLGYKLEFREFPSPRFLRSNVPRDPVKKSFLDHFLSQRVISMVPLEEARFRVLFKPVHGSKTKRRSQTHFRYQRSNAVFEYRFFSFLFQSDQ